MMKHRRRLLAALDSEKQPPYDVDLNLAKSFVSITSSKISVTIGTNSVKMSSTTLPNTERGTRSRFRYRLRAGVYSFSCTATRTSGSDSGGILRAMVHIVDTTDESNMAGPSDWVNISTGAKTISFTFTVKTTGIYDLALYYTYKYGPSGNFNGAVTYSSIKLRRTS